MVRAFFIFLLLLVCAPVTHAQGTGVASITLTATPTYPRPYETIKLSVTGSLVNLNTSTITISVDGKVISEGSKTASFQAGKAGSTSTVTATVVSSGKTYTARVVIRPADVALILEPQTTAHPFYDGARLVAPNAQVRLVALPEIRDATGALVPNSRLSFEWKLGNKLLQAQSGLGKNVLNAVAPVRYRDAQVSVKVSTTDEAYVALGNAVVSATTPLVRIYPNNPLSGTNFASAIASTYALKSAEETFEAVPYFFADLPNVIWLLNGNTSGTERQVTVRTTGNKSGTALLTATAKLAGGESAESRFTLQFNSGSTNIFGF